MKKVGLLATLLLAFALAGCNSAQESDASGSSQNVSSEVSVSSSEDVSSSSEATPQVFSVTFVPDAHVKVYIFEDSDYEKTPVLGNSAEAEYEGQVNFKLEVDDGYELAAKPSIAPETGYNKLKTPADTLVAGCYRITKVTADLTVTITTQEEAAVEEGFLVSFVCDSHTSIKVYPSQNYEVEPTAATETQSVDVDTGKPTMNTEIAQVNFLIVVEEGYAVTANEISITGTYKNLKSQGSNIWRITKIQSNLTVTISAVTA